jgi:hypothetical protein
MKLRMGMGLIVVAALAMTAPAWSKTSTAKANVDLMQPTMVAGTSVTLQPGSYEFRMKVDDPNVEILKDNKVVANVQGQWVHLDSKAPDTEVISNENAIQEIDIKGDTEALRFSKG